MDRIIGSTGIRLLTIALGAAFVGILAVEPPAGDLAGWKTVAAVLTAILTFVGLVHCFERLYAAWLRFTKRLHKVVIAVLFGTCYLVVVPCFALMVWPFDLLGLRGEGRAKTFWHRRRHARADSSSFRRMG